MDIGCCESERFKSTENCAVCGEGLEYFEEAVKVVCNFCGKKERGYIKCPKGHYICDGCHGKNILDLIRKVALSTDQVDPLSIAELMMSNPELPMLGCEHAIIASVALISALKNRKSLDIRDNQIDEVLERTKKQSISGYCGLTGVCGVAVGIGAVFSVLLSATCSKDRESAIVMHCVSRVIDAIGNDVGPMCCKSFVRTALGVSYSLLKEYLNIDLPIHREKISCFYSERHPHTCRGSKCLYYPKR
jgi:hypothetical protein